MVAAMHKLLSILALLPTPLFAQSVPNPTVFTYDTAFARCTENPNTADLFKNCSAIIADAYVLNRAVALAFQMCAPAGLRDCTLPFEDAGLPAFGIQIAVDVGCDATEFALFSEFDPLPAEHCIAFASDILADEGAVPLDTHIACATINDECNKLAFVQYQLWNQALLDLENGPRHDPTIRDLIGRQTRACGADPETATDKAQLTGEFANCMSDGIAQLWRDLVLEGQG